MVWAFSSSGFGTQFSNPSSGPSASARGIAFNPATGISIISSGYGTTIYTPGLGLHQVSVQSIQVLPLLQVFSGIAHLARTATMYWEGPTHLLISMFGLVMIVHDSVQNTLTLLHYQEMLLGVSQ